MKLSIITDQIHQDLETALSLIQQEGYQYVELHNVFGKSIETCTDEEVQEIKRLLQKYHMEVTNIASTIFLLCPLYTTDKVSFFSPTFCIVEGNVEQHLEHLRNACKIAKELSCPRVRLFPFRWPDNREVPFGDTKDQEEICKNLVKAVEIAEEYDVTLVLENCPYSHCPKGEMTKTLIETVNNEHLKLLWDPANSYRAIKENVPERYLRLSLLEELELVYPYIDHIHVKDYHYDPRFEKPFVHVPMYDGDINYDELFAYIKGKNYDKAVSLEQEVTSDEALLCMRRIKEMN